VREVPLSKFGLMTVKEAAELRGVDRKTVQRWVTAGHIAAVPISVGANGMFLVVAEEVKAFTPSPAGAPRKEKPKAKRGK
jgi:excisionase family DNA binding protein